MQDVGALPTRDADCFVIFGESYTLQRARFESQKMDMEALKEELDVSFLMKVKKLVC